MKRVLSVLIAAVLCLGAAFADAPAVAQSMTEVTQKVVDTLGIGEEYTDFNGQYNGGMWSLSWEKEDGSLSVSCDADGVIYDFYRFDYSNEKPGFSGGARFPDTPAEVLAATAEEFLDAVLPEGWGWELGEIDEQLYRGYYASTMASGRLTLDGKPTDISFTITLDAMSGNVTGYHRDDAYDMRSVSIAKDVNPDEAAYAKAKAELLSLYEMEAVYMVINEKDMARLVYRAKNSDRIAIDYESGEQMRFSASRFANDALFAASETEEAADKGTGSSRQLTETELAGIKVYEDAMTSDELDAVIKAMPEFGLGDSDKPEQAGYYLSDDKVYATLTYYVKKGESEYLYMNFYMDAVKGKIMSLYSYSTASQAQDMPEPDYEKWQKNADDFLNKYYADYSASLRRTGSAAAGGIAGKPSARYSYVRTHKGYDFPANSASVTIDTFDGSVVGLSLNWNDGQEFYEYAENEIIDAEKAKRIWTNDAEPSLMYLSVPKMREWGRMTYELKLGWCFDADYVYAVDAENGTRYGEAESGKSGAFTYEDTSAMLYAPEILALAQYGIGLKDCAFTASDMLTARRLMILALQMEGNVNVEEYEDEALIRTFNNRYGISLNNPEIILTRGEAAAIMVKIAGYGEAAKLEGIYTMKASDWDDIPENAKGGLAIAKALGFIDTEDGALNPYAQAPAALFAHMIYAWLCR